MQVGELEAGAGSRDSRRARSGRCRARTRQAGAHWRARSCGADPHQRRQIVDDADRPVARHFGGPGGGRGPRPFRPKSSKPRRRRRIKRDATYLGRGSRHRPAHHRAPRRHKQQTLSLSAPPREPRSAPRQPSCGGTATGTPRNPTQRFSWWLYDAATASLGAFAAIGAVIAVSAC